MAKTRPQRRIDRNVAQVARNITVTGGGTGGGLTSHTHTGYATDEDVLAVVTSAIATHGANPNAHHDRLHDILGVDDHEITAAAYTLVGATLTDTLGKLYISSSGDGIDVTKSGGNFTIAVDVSDIHGDGLGDDGSNNLYVRTDEGITTSGGDVIVDEAYDFAWTGDHSHTQLVGSASFSSGWAGSGWRIDTSDASLELNNLTVRGQLSVYELLVRQIRATNGNVFVSAGAKIESVTGSGPYVLTTTGDTGDFQPFAVGDLIRAQRFTGSGVFQSNMQVTGVLTGGNARAFTATLTSGDAPAAEMEFVRLGSTSDSTRRGSLYLSADDTYSPFIDVIDGVSSFADWNTADVLKVRIGELSGISDPYFGALSNKYGIYAKGNAYFRGQIYADSGEIGLTNNGLELDASTQDGSNFILFTEEVGQGFDVSKLAAYIAGYRYDDGTTHSTLNITAQANVDWASDEADIYILASGEDGANASVELKTTYNTADVYITAWDEQSPTVRGDIWLRGEVKVVLGDVLPTGNQNLGSSGAPWDKLYVNELIAGTTSTTDTGHNHDDRYYTESEVDSLLSGKSDTTHTHAGYVLTSTYTAGLATKADASHTHDDRYYTESETDALLANKSATGHAHDSRYYTESEVDSLLSSYVTSSSLTTTLGSYVTSSSLSTTLSSYVTSAGLTATLGGYYSEAEVDALLGGYSLTTHSHTSLPLTEITYGGSATINIGTDGTLSSANYVSGRTGYSLGPSGLEANNADIRGVIRSGMLQAQGTLYSYGTQIFAPSAKLRDAMTVTAHGTQITVAVDDGDAGHVQVFAVGEILNVKGPAYIEAVQNDEDSIMDVWTVLQTPAAVELSSDMVASVWLEVDSVSDETTHWEYTCTVKYGPRSVFSPGAIVGSYGTETTGRIQITSDALYAPYMDVFTSGSTPWTGVTPHLRIGRLDGLAVGSSDRTTPEYGMAAATDLTDSDSSWLITSNRRIKGNNIDLSFADGDMAMTIDASDGITWSNPMAAAGTWVTNSAALTWYDSVGENTTMYVGPYYDSQLFDELSIIATHHESLGTGAFEGNYEYAAYVRLAAEPSSGSPGTKTAEIRLQSTAVYYQETGGLGGDEFIEDTAHINIIADDGVAITGDLSINTSVRFPDRVNGFDLPRSSLDLPSGFFYVDSSGYVRIVM